jgi:heme A synthase
MVKSGLKEELMEAKSFHGVSQYWLAAHLGSAFVIYSLLLLSGMEILGSRAAIVASQVRILISDLFYIINRWCIFNSLHAEPKSHRCPTWICRLP